MTPETHGIEISVQSSGISIKLTRFITNPQAAWENARKALAILLEEPPEAPRTAAVLPEVRTEVHKEVSPEVIKKPSSCTPEKAIHPNSREPPNLKKAVDELRALINENHGKLPYGTILSLAKKYDLKPNGINYRLKTLGITYKVMTCGGNIRKPSKLPRSFSTAVEEAMRQAGPQKKITPEAVTNLLAQFGINSYRPEFMQRLSMFDISCLPALTPLPESTAVPALPPVKDPEPVANKRTCSHCDFYEPLNNLNGLCNSSDEPRNVSADGYCKFFDFKGA